MARPVPGCLQQSRKGQRLPLRREGIDAHIAAAKTALFRHRLPLVGIFHGLDSTAYRRPKLLVVFLQHTGQYRPQIALLPSQRRNFRTRFHQPGLCVAQFPLQILSRSRGCVASSAGRSALKLGADAGSQ